MQKATTSIPFLQRIGTLKHGTRSCTSRYHKRGGIKGKRRGGRKREMEGDGRERKEEGEEEVMFLLLIRNS